MKPYTQKISPSRMRNFKDFINDYLDDIILTKSNIDGMTEVANLAAAQQKEVQIAGAWADRCVANLVALSVYFGMDTYCPKNMLFFHSRSLNKSKLLKSSVDAYLNKIDHRRTATIRGINLREDTANYLFESSKDTYKFIPL